MENLFINQRQLLAWAGMFVVLIAGAIVGINLSVDNSNLRVIPAGSAIPVEIEVTSGLNDTFFTLTAITDLPDTSPLILIGSESRGVQLTHCLSTTPKQVRLQIAVADM